MKQRFSSILVRSPEGGYRIALIAALLMVALVFSAFSLAPAAHATSVSNDTSARPNACEGSFPCVTVWETDAKVRSCPKENDTDCPKVGILAGGNETVLAFCQEQGGTVHYDGFVNNWWTHLIADNGNNGWTSNILIVGGQMIAGVPVC